MDSQSQISPTPIVRFGDFMFRYRNILFPAVYLALFLFSRPSALLGYGREDIPAFLLGIILAISGQIFRLVVIGYAYIKRGGKEGKVYADNLVVRGFYAHSRNPMYIGNVLIVIGICVMYGSIAAWAIVIPFFLFSYLAITSAEEAYLRRSFGAEYDDYARRVNRFWPNFSGLGKSLEEFTYDWKRALRKDYGNIFQTLGLILIIAVWKVYAVYDAPGWVFGLGAALFLFGLGLYAFVRRLKKTGALASPNG